MPPKWFWAILALCLVGLTAATASRLRWHQAADGVLVDSWRGRLCVPEGCIPLGRTPVATANGSPLYEAYLRQRARRDTAKAMMDTLSPPR